MRRFLFAVALVATTPGCFAFTTKHEGEVMEREIKGLDQRVAKQEESVGERVKQLDASLEQATKLLARNSADLGADVQKMSDEVARLTGLVETMRRDQDALKAELADFRMTVSRRLDALEARGPGTGTGGTAGTGGTGTTVTPTPTPVVDKKALYDGAQAKLNAGQYEDARRDLRLFVQKFPQDERADDAQYLVGESFFREKQYEKAIGEFQRIIDTWPNGDMFDDAFYQAGAAAAAMKWCTDARAYYSVLLQRQPKSPFAKNAKQKMDYLKKQAKNKAVCQS